MGINSINRSVNNLQIPANYSNLATLSKTKFVTGLQCLKALHYTCFSPKLRDPIPTERQKVFTQGTNIGIYAREVYPGGELINETPRQTAEAVNHTLSAIQQANVGDAIYEAAFEQDGIVVRADLLIKNEDDSWDLIEVKSAKSVKEVNIRDVGIQTYVIEKSGIKLKNIRLMHMSREYDYQNPDWSNIKNNFVEQDIMSSTRTFVKEIPKHLKRMKKVLGDPTVIPDISVGTHCQDPYQCAFFGQCHK